MPLLEQGWIELPSLELHRECMAQFPDNSIILENGSAVGRLFYYLYDYYPNWEYHGNDLFWSRTTRLLDKRHGHGDEYILNKGKQKSGAPVANDDVFKNFKKNCPYASVHVSYFTDVNLERKADLISMGLMESNVNWLENYKYAVQLLKPDGIIIARNLNHPTLQEEIEHAIDKCGLKIEERTDEGCAILTRGRLKIWNVYIGDEFFGPKWRINPICIRYWPMGNGGGAGVYAEWLESLVSNADKRQWELNNPPSFGNVLTTFLKENIDCPSNVISKIIQRKNMCVLFTEYCETFVLKSHYDLNNANYLDIKIPLMLDDSKFPYIDLLKEYMQNDQPKKVLHIDFGDWINQDPALCRKIKKYYNKLIGNDLHDALNAIDPVYQGSPHFAQQWEKICNIINNADVGQLEYIRIEIVFGSLVRDKYMSTAHRFTPSYDNILLWCEKMKKELTIPEGHVTYLHSCSYMEDPGHSNIIHTTVQKVIH